MMYRFFTVCLLILLPAVAAAEMAFPLDGHFSSEMQQLLDQETPITAEDVFPKDPVQALEHAYKCGGIDGLNDHISSIYKRQEIHYAAVQGDTLQVKELLLQHPDHLNMRDAMHSTPLILAAKAGKLGVVHALLDAGADATLDDGYGRTARDWAEFYQWSEVVAVFDARKAPQ